METIPWLLTVAVALLSWGTAAHALIHKRDPRAALGWIAVCLVFPIAGPLLYSLFGVNRIRTRGRKLQHRWSWVLDAQPTGVGAGEAADTDASVPAEYSELKRVSDAVTHRRLVGSNRVEMLHNGEQVYPAMLRSIEQAGSSVFLATYIFETNATGRRFIDCLARATERGVDVRVLLDGVGALHSLPRSGRLLRKRQVEVAYFLPPRLFPPALHLNLRNHRKILVVDGREAFTGGMNIGDRHLADDEENPHRVVDLHFRLAGPVVSQIEDVFLEDWGFASGHTTNARAVEPRTAGTAVCRTIVDGPNEDIDKLIAVLVGAVSAASRRIAIMTPYFLPPRELGAALEAAALRGVEVDVILPERNNLIFVHWATRNMLWELLKYGVRVFYQPPPFAHSKLFLVDEEYAQIGSANLDPRSLRLNFELAVEVYDRSFAAALYRHFDATRTRSKPVTLEEVDGRPLPIRARDALAWLFSPYL